MAIEFLKEIFDQNRGNTAIIWGSKEYTYGWLLDTISLCRQLLDKDGVHAGTVAILESDLSPLALASFLALIEKGCIVVPLSSVTSHQRVRLIEIAQGEVLYSLTQHDEVEGTRLSFRADHPLYQELRARRHPGLVLFSSGSTGEAKAAIHDLTKLLQKFKVRRKTYRTIGFLLFDHIGGLNTILYTLSNAGCLVTAADRQPDTILRLIEQYRVELLPTTPTFVNLVLLSGAYRDYDLTSLKLVTYGTEPMLESVLESFHKHLPYVELKQTYGLTEVGILDTKSKAPTSLYMKVGGANYETRIVDGMLQIKTDSAMLGYLNASSPFTEDGWLVTRDLVEVDANYIKILGRDSEIINVGGQKVFPAEVESVIQSLEDVADVVVYGEKNPILGNIVCARVKLRQPTVDKGRREFILKLKKFCTATLEPYKVPIKVFVIEDELHSNRFKKMRHSS